MVKRKFKKLPNQFDSFGGNSFNTSILKGWAHNIPNERRKAKQALLRGEYSLE